MSEAVSHGRPPCVSIVSDEANLRVCNCKLCRCYGECLATHTLEDDSLRTSITHPLAASSSSATCELKLHILSLE
jgi:hypothetical protein